MAILVAEAVLRALDHRAVTLRLRTVSEDVDEASLGPLKRYSANEKIIFELKPNLVDVQFLGVPVSTNSMGFRGPELSRGKPPGLVRVVGLGDSVMFGWGVPQEESYLALLERLLSERHPERRWEVVNTGVPGYNTVMEVATLLEKGLRLDPDVVVLNLVSNDLNLPILLAQRRDHLGLSECFLKTFLYERLGWIAPRSDLFVPIEREGSDFRLYEQDPELLPLQHRGMVGWEAFEGALDDLRAMSQQHGFDVVTLRLWWYTILQEMEARAAARGFATSVVLEQPGDWSLDESLRLSAEDSHPSAEMHRLTAEALYEDLKRLGVLARAMD